MADLTNLVCTFQRSGVPLIYTHAECSFHPAWVEPAWDDYGLVLLKTLPPDLTCEVCWLLLTTPLPPTWSEMSYDEVYRTLRMERPS